MIIEKVVLTRTEQKDDGVFGLLQLYHDGEVYVSYMTAEDDWRNNKPAVSCIVAGTYTLNKTIYHKHNFPTYEVTGVPNRSRILIHPGNTEEDSQGCILVGMAFGLIKVKEDEDTGEKNKKKFGVVQSKQAFSDFMNTMKNTDQCMLIVKWNPGLPKDS